MLDHMLLSIQADAQQISSLNDFTDSLVRELKSANKPEQNLMRELLAPCLNRALNIGGTDAKRRFLDALAINIHKFPLQEQQSLSKVYPVEISSEYRNLVSFVADDKDDDNDDVLIVAETAPRLALPPPPPRVTAAVETLVINHATLEDLRRRLAALPGVPVPAADELLSRLMQEDLPRIAQESEEKPRAAFFADLRLNLFKFSEHAQKRLLDRFEHLRADVVRLVESMTNEIARWLDEERFASQRNNLGPLLTKLQALFKATLSVPFLATFKHLDANEKKAKKAFLLRVALCLRTCSEKKYADLQGIFTQIAELRKQFFFVKDYGEFMEEWLNIQVDECNEEFETRAAAVIGANLASVMQRLRRTFKPGKWISLLDSKLLDDFYYLFLDASFPKHVLRLGTIVKVLKKIAATGGGDFHIYGDIARAPPQRYAYVGAPAQDDIDAAVIEILQRIPPFPTLKKQRRGLFFFGRIEVEFDMIGDGALMARSSGADGMETGEQFFMRVGPEEFPQAAMMAVHASQQQVDGPMSTSIEVAGSFAPVPLALGGPLPLPPVASGSLQPLVLGQPQQALPPMPGLQRYQPYPGGQGGTKLAPSPPTQNAVPACFGVDDDEI